MSRRDPIISGSGRVYIGGTIFEALGQLLIQACQAAIDPLPDWHTRVASWARILVHQESRHRNERPRITDHEG